MRFYIQVLDTGSISSNSDSNSVENSITVCISVIFPFDENFNFNKGFCTCFIICIKLAPDLFMNWKTRISFRLYSKNFVWSHTKALKIRNLNHKGHIW